MRPILRSIGRSLAAVALAGSALRGAMVGYEPPAPADPCPECAVSVVLDFTHVEWGVLSAGAESTVTGDASFGTSGAPTIVNDGEAGVVVGIVFEPLVSGEARIEGSFGARMRVGEGEVSVSRLTAGRAGWFDGVLLCPGDAAAIDVSLRAPGVVAAGDYEGALSIEARRPQGGSFCDVVPAPPAEGDGEPFPEAPAPVPGEPDGAEQAGTPSGGGAPTSDPPRTTSPSEAPAPPSDAGESPESPSEAANQPRAASPPLGIEDVLRACGEGGSPVTPDDGDDDGLLDPGEVWTTGCGSPDVEPAGEHSAGEDLATPPGTVRYVVAHRSDMTVAVVVGDADVPWEEARPGACRSPVSVDSDGEGVARGDDDGDGVLDAGETWTVTCLRAPTVPAAGPPEGGAPEGGAPEGGASEGGSPDGGGSETGGRPSPTSTERRLAG